jgi:hypothetical protein
MILRLSSPAARGLRVLLALILGAGLCYSRPVYDAERNTPQRRELHSIGDSVVSTGWTDDIPGTRQCTRIELSGNSGKYVVELQPYVSGLRGATFASKTGGPASLDGMVWVPRSAENPKR